jgi:hypothetical protein
MGAFTSTRLPNRPTATAGDRAAGLGAGRSASVTPSLRVVHLSSAHYAADTRILHRECASLARFFRAFGGSAVAYLSLQKLSRQWKFLAGLSHAGSALLGRNPLI